VKEKLGTPLCSLVWNEIAALTHGSHVHVRNASGMKFAELKDEAVRVEPGAPRIGFCTNPLFLRRTLIVLKKKASTIGIFGYSLGGGKTRNSSKLDKSSGYRPKLRGIDGNEGSNPQSGE